MQYQGFLKRNCYIIKLFDNYSNSTLLLSQILLQIQLNYKNSTFKIPIMTETKETGIFNCTSTLPIVMKTRSTLNVLAFKRFKKKENDKNVPF